VLHLLYFLSINCTEHHLSTKIIYSWILFFSPSQVHPTLSTSGNM